MRKVSGTCLVNTVIMFCTVSMVMLAIMDKEEPTGSHL